MAAKKKQASKVVKKAAKKSVEKKAAAKKTAKKATPKVSKKQAKKAAVKKVAKKAAKKTPKKSAKKAKSTEQKVSKKKVAKKVAKKISKKKSEPKPAKSPKKKVKPGDKETKKKAAAKPKAAKSPSSKSKKDTKPKNKKKNEMKETLNKPVKLTAFVKKQYQRLLDLRDELVDTTFDKAQDTLRNHPEGSEANGSGMHQGDAGSDAYDRDLALNILSKEHDALYEIEEALRRVERGAYGICEMSGDKIPKERLEAIPFCRLTVQCQEKWEEKHGKHRYRREDEAGFSGLTL